MKIDSIAKHKLAITSALVAVVACVFLTTYSFAFDSLPQTSLTFTKSYRTISVSWAPVTDAKLYAVYSADDANGTSAKRIAVVDAPSFNDTLLKPGSGRSYAVQSGAGRDGLESVDMSTLNWSSVQQVPAVGSQASKGEGSESAKQKNKSRSAATQFEASGEPIFSPHKGAGYVADSKDGCTSCHIAHDANNHSLIVSSGAGGHENAAIAICLDCHDQDTSAEKAFVGSVFKDRGALSGHFVETEEAKLECVTCHGPHQDSNKADNGLKPLTIKKFGSPPIESLTVDSARPNNQCTTCHDDAQTWYTATNAEASYPTSRVLATGADVPEGYEGYPKSGTYPGATVANDATKNGHADIAASDGHNKGDCRYCHTSHASSAPYDGLLAERGELRAMKGSTPEAINAERISGAYASFCLSCHNGSNAGTPWAAAANIADTVSFPVGSSETSPAAFLESSAGHTVKSPNATIPQGSAMPCYSCHDTHGNAAGNVKNLSASLATGITQDKLNYEFCLTCHVTAYGKVSNADSSELVSLEDSDLPKTVLGLSRTGVDNINSVETSNSLKLSANVDGHKAGVTHSCTMCHGDIHSPAALGSSEPSATLNRKDCIGCHGEDFEAAKNIVFTPDATGKEATVAYSPHMVPAFSESMGANFFPEYILRGVPSPFTPIDPSIDANKKPYCAGYHAWCSNDVASIEGLPLGRDMTPGATLRESYNSPQPANTDFIHTTGNPKLGGLCLSCHNNYLGTKTVGAPTKGPLNDRNNLDSEDYDDSAHNYTVPVTRYAASDTEVSIISKTFRANCAKCHNSSDAIIKPLENADKLQLVAHYTPGRRLLARIGIIADIAKPSSNSNPDIRHAQDFNNKGECFGCHSRKGEIDVPAGKQYENMDWYGVKSMAGHETKWENSSGEIMGTQTHKPESIFDNMFVIKNKEGLVDSFSSGDGGGGDVGSVDAQARAALIGKEELSGHQVTRSIDINRLAGDGSAPEKFALRGYVRKNMTSIRCSDCHNVHSPSKASLGTYTDWPTTKKPRVDTQVSTAFADTTTPNAAIANDGSRLITLNDYWARDAGIERWNLKGRIDKWLMEIKGVGDAAERSRMIEEMQFNGISTDLFKQINKDTKDKDWWEPFSPADIKLWENTADISCYRCHDFASMDTKSHKVPTHQKNAIACVNCHLPEVHGSKMHFLLGDRGAIPGIDDRASGVVALNHSTMQPQLIFRWTNYSHNTNIPIPNTLNQPTLKLLGYKTSDLGNEAWKPTSESCATTEGCHTAPGSDSIQTGWSHWTGRD